VFTGQGEVDYVNSPLTDTFRGTYTPIVLYAGDYVLAQQDGQWGLRRIATPTTLSPFNVYATLSSQAAFIPLPLSSGIKTIAAENDASDTIFDLQGRRMTVKALKPGLYIKNGKKFIIK
jgi:hypothetical protein